MHVPEGMKETAKNTVKTFFFETITSALGSYISGFFEGFKRQAHETGTHFGSQTAKLFEEHRDEMFAWIHGEFAAETTDHNTGVSLAHENFKRRWKLREMHAHKPYPGPNCLWDMAAKTCGRPDCNWRYKSGTEIAFVVIFTGAFKNLGDKEEYESRRNLFEYYFSIKDDEEFDAEIEQLNHDVLRQYGKRLWEFLRSAKTFTKENWQELEDGPFKAFADFTGKLPGAKQADPGAGTWIRLIALGTILSLLMLLCIWS